MYSTSGWLSAIFIPFPKDDFLRDFMYVAQVIRSIKTKDPELLAKQKSVAKRLVDTYQNKWYHVLSQRGNIHEIIEIEFELIRRYKILLEFIEYIEYAK
jgi:hypothetical protein